MVSKIPTLFEFLQACDSLARREIELEKFICFLQEAKEIASSFPLLGHMIQAIETDRPFDAYSYGEEIRRTLYTTAFHNVACAMKEEEDDI